MAVASCCYYILLAGFYKGFETPQKDAGLPCSTMKGFIYGGCLEHESEIPLWLLTRSSRSGIVSVHPENQRFQNGVALGVAEC
jgi:hypothetical protein